MWRIVPPILVAVAASAAASPDCEDYSDYPHLLARVPVPGTVHDVATVGSRAYVASSTHGGGFVHVVDLGDPQHPVLGAAIGGFGGGGAITAEGGYLYVVFADGLHVLDLADPASPVPVGSLDADYHSWRLVVDVEGGIAYVVAGGAIDIVDVSDPTSPALLATMPNGASNIAAAGSSLLVCAGAFLNRYDVTDPTVPVLVDFHEAEADPWTETVGFASVALSGENVLAARNHTFYDFYGDPVGWRADFVTFDLSDLSVPRGSVSLGDAYSGHLHAAASYAYVSSRSEYLASRPTGLNVVDVSSPSDPVVVHRNWAGPSGETATLEVAGRHILCEARGTLGVQVRDVTNPDRPHEVDGPGPGPYTHFRYHDVAASEDRAYTAETFFAAGYGYGYTLTAFDLSDPPNPVPLGSTGQPDAGPYKEVVLAGGDLYLRGVAWLYRSRLTDPAHPEPPVRLEGLTQVRDVEAQDPFLWVARGSPGLLVLDASVPGDPAVVAEVPDHWVNALSVDGHRMCTVGGGSFRTADVSDPAAPVFLGELPMDGSWVACRGDLAVVGQDTGALRFVDVGNEMSPVELSSLELADASLGATFHGTRAYVAAGPQGLLVLDLTDPLSPVIQGGLASDPSRAVELHDGWLLFTEVGGFHVLPLDCTATPGPDFPLPLPASSRLSQVWPNPFVLGTTIGYALDRPGPVRLELFDVTGRRVRTLLARTRRAGRWTHEWDGLDASGRPVPAGVYFLRLETTASSATRRVTRLR